MHRGKIIDISFQNNENHFASQNSKYDLIWESKCQSFRAKHMLPGYTKLNDTFPRQWTLAVYAISSLEPSLALLWSVWISMLPNSSWAQLRS